MKAQFIQCLSSRFFKTFVDGERADDFLAGRAFQSDTTVHLGGEVVAPDEADRQLLGHLELVGAGACIWGGQEEVVLVQVRGFVDDVEHHDHISSSTAVLEGGKFQTSAVPRRADVEVKGQGA